MSADHDHDEPGEKDVLIARVKALESLLIEKGILSTDGIDYIGSVFEEQVGPKQGAKVVARAWVDPAFKERLLADATAACRELGVTGFEGDGLMTHENAADVHNLIVCTLCSCYPWSVLGLPPNWYKNPAYRSRAVRDPRSVMSEFGLEVGEDVEVRVWDSSADLRHWVLPARPEGTEGWTEDRLAELVTRDSMIGVTRALSPEEVGS